MPETEQARSDDFSGLFETVQLGVYRADAEGRLLHANGALARLNGFADAAELIASVADVRRDWHVDADRAGAFERALESAGHVAAFESEVCRRKTGERLWVAENAHLVRDAAGAVRFREGTVEDISARTRRRQALQADLQQLRQVVELVPGMVYRVVVLPGGRRRATFISSGVRTLYGVEPEAALADGRLVNRARHPDDVARVEAAARAASEQRLPLQIEFRIRSATGTQKWVQVISAPAPDEDGEQVRIGAVFDINERKQAEQASESLRLERDRAATADIAKSQFLSRVSHELRTPLNAILGFAQLLEIEPPGGGDAERRRGWIAHVLASGRHLLALMDDILDLSSAQTGQLPVAAESVALRPVVEESLDMLSGSALVADVSVTVGERAAVPAESSASQGLVPDGLAGEGLRVRADRKRVKQIVSNLLSNAIKYNRRGGWVHVQARALDGSVELTVQDSGAGIAAEQLARLFQPFERLGAQRGPVTGTGLGLALSRQLAESMGGGIDVQSEPGQGTVFRLRLPRA